MSYHRAFLHGIQLETLLTVSEWSDQNRILSSVASSEPGPWRTSRVPYLREIMDCLSPSSSTNHVVFMSGSQLGKTECGLNWLGYIIQHTPGPILMVQPTVEMAKTYSKQRITHLIQESPALKGLVRESRSRDSGNTVLVKEFQGGMLRMSGANSAASLASMPVRFLFLDEIDRYPGDVNGEGDPVALAIQRTATFANRKILMVSTPTIKGFSRIESAYAESDEISFKGAVQLLNAFREKIGHALGAKRIQLRDELLRAIAFHRIGNRPGRVEPRAVKRRPKPFPRLTTPRTELRFLL